MNAPPGSDNDPRAPWNEERAEFTGTCDDCGSEIVAYSQEIMTPDADYFVHYCEDCMNKRYRDYIREVKPTLMREELPTFKDFLKIENYEEL